MTVGDLIQYLNGQIVKLDTPVQFVLLDSSEYDQEISDKPIHPLYIIDNSRFLMPIQDGDTNKVYITIPLKRRTE